MPEHCEVRREYGDKKMRSLKSLIAISAFSLVVLALPSIASAQWRDDDYYGRNGGYGNGSYNRNIRGTAQNLKNRARNFERLTNRIEDRDDDRRNDRYGRGGYGGYGGYGRGNVSRLEDLADNFKRAADRFADSYGNGRNLNNSADEARRLLEIGGQIDQELYQARGGQRLSREWSMIRQDLNVIGSVYGYGGYNNGYPGRTYPGQNYPNRNGDWRNRIPFPLPF
jgi:hypothetical protein